MEHLNALDLSKNVCSHKAPLLLWERNMIIKSDQIMVTTSGN